MRSICISGAVLYVGFCAASTVVLSREPNPPLGQTVQSILNSKCLSCHDNSTRRSGFSVESLEDILAGGARNGPSVMPGNPDESPLVQVLRGTLQPRMPFDSPDPLPDSDIETIERWIRGLKPDVHLGTAASHAVNYWALKKPARHDPPEVQQKNWARNEIDHFILEKLEEKSLSPAPEADRRVLIRRLYFNVIGLPPTPEEVEAFVEEPSPTAYEELADRLLADSRYGERWARHWLDLARYADTNGYEGDRDYPHAWRYRDYVIDAFNNDKPYDLFIKEQIAGDEFFKVTSAAGYPPLPEPEQAVALTFLRLAPFTEPRGEYSRDLMLSEMTSTVSSVFLGLTVGCAKCHDHKYDPIPTEDFYRMKAFFATVRIPRAKIEVGDPIPAEFYRLGDKERFDSRRAQEEKKLKALQAEFETYYEPLLERLSAAKREEMAELEQGRNDLVKEIQDKRALQSQLVGLLAKGELGASELDEKNSELERLLTKKMQDLKKVTEALEELAPKNGGKEEAPLVSLSDLEKLIDDDDNTVGFEKKEGLFSKAEKTKFNHYSGEIGDLELAVERLQPMAMGLTNYDGPPYAPSLPATHVLIRGRHDMPGKAVEPGFLSAIEGHAEPAEIEIDRYKKHPSRGRRMALAQWITSPDNPLTARVMVNRLWQYNFGRGIVETANDFGKNGKPPSHPELLDWLALRFVDEKWSVKAIQRLMLTSSSYRQASVKIDSKAPEIDLENRLLWRFNRRRLEGEVIRDTVLAISGRLNPELGGPPIFPALPAGMEELTSAASRGAARWDTTTGPEARKRSIYVYQRRSQPLPFLEVFDAPPLTVPCARRETSITPLQALAMYDSRFTNEAAEFFARRVAAQSGPDSQARIRQAFQLALGRSPAAEEVVKTEELVGSLSEEQRLVALCRVLLNSSELLYID